MADALSATTLWQRVSQNFISDDGSLPTVELQHLMPQEVGGLYELIRAGARVVSEDATFWDLSSERDRALDDVVNAGALVPAGQAAPFHFAVEGVREAGVSVPCLGVHVFQDSIAIDYRMGVDWRREQVWAFFLWLRRLLSGTQAGVLKLGEEAPPEGESFMAAWKWFQENQPSDRGSP